MSVALFDLGQRLRAAASGRPTARSAFAPVTPPIDPVAVMIAGSGDRVLVRAAHRAGLSTGGGPSALAALSELGVSISAAPRTLVVADHQALSRLLALAEATDASSPEAGAAAVVAWWSLRADHPGSGAVLNVSAACSARWVLGVPPGSERQVGVWRAWLGVADRGPRGLLDMAAAVSAGTVLPGLDALADDDRDSWDSFVARTRDTKANWDWRRRDSRREAALGLATRCDAAELWQSLRLGDPLVAVRESFAGTVVSGVVTSVPSRDVLEVTLDRLACRLRERTAVEGFAGYPRDVPPALLAAPLVRGTVSATRVTLDERLVLTIDAAAVRSGAVRRGQRITLRPRSVDPRQQRSGRYELHRRYAARRSWLSGGAAPVPRRRDVPLDVVVAAATD
ncbi:MAG TPA: hypothetical protein VFG86_05485 [Chloroflexota bacterium]|nr:hypothetical protein [Chloroflexota bacterium]